jgi:hypothetical protein
VEVLHGDCWREVAGEWFYPQRRLTPSPTLRTARTGKDSAWISVSVEQSQPTREVEDWSGKRARAPVGGRIGAHGGVRVTETGRWDPNAVSADVTGKVGHASQGI